MKGPRFIFTKMSIVPVEYFNEYLWNTCINTKFLRLKPWKHSKRIKCSRKVENCRWSKVIPKQHLTASKSSSIPEIKCVTKEAVWLFSVGDMKGTSALPQKVSWHHRERMIVLIVSLVRPMEQLLHYYKNNYWIEQNLNSNSVNINHKVTLILFLLLIQKNQLIQGEI